MYSQQGNSSRIVCIYYRLRVKITIENTCIVNVFQILLTCNGSRCMYNSRFSLVKCLTEAGFFKIAQNTLEELLMHSMSQAIGTSVKVYCLYNLVSYRWFLTLFWIIIPICPSVLVSTFRFAKRPGSSEQMWTQFRDVHHEANQEYWWTHLCWSWRLQYESLELAHL